MTCEIKSEHHPVQIRCSFPDVTETKRDFSVYFHSSGGSQNAVANCVFNGVNKCLAEEGFQVTLEGLNAASLTVPDSFATKTGMFVCQKGDLPFIKNCEFPLTENFTAGNSFNSEVVYGTTTNVIPSFVTNEHFGNEDDNKLLIICATVSVIVVVIVLILLITIIWLKRRKTRRRIERSDKSKIHRYTETQLSEDGDKSKIPFLGNESKSHELVQGGLKAELTKIDESNTTTNSQFLGIEFYIIEEQEITDKEYPTFNISPTPQSSMHSIASNKSKAALIPH